MPGTLGNGILFASNISFLWFGVVGTGVTLIAGYVASLMFPSPTDAQLNGLVINRKSSDLTEQPALDRA